MIISSYKTEIVFLTKKLEIPKINLYQTEEFLKILDYIESKGLLIEPPVELDGWDASFVQRKLERNPFSLTAKDFFLFLYMRAHRNTPVFLDWKFYDSDQ